MSCDPAVTCNGHGVCRGNSCFCDYLWSDRGCTTHWNVVLDEPFYLTYRWFTFAATLGTLVWICFRLRSMIRVERFKVPPQSHVDPVLDGRKCNKRLPLRVTVLLSWAIGCVFRLLDFGIDPHAWAEVWPPAVEFIFFNVSVFAWLYAVASLLRFWMLLESQFSEKNRRLLRAYDVLNVVLVICITGVFVARAVKLRYTYVTLVYTSILAFYSLCQGAGFVVYGRHLVLRLRSSQRRAYQLSKPNLTHIIRIRRISHLTWSVGVLAFALILILTLAWVWAPDYPDRDYIISFNFGARICETALGIIVVYALGDTIKGGGMDSPTREARKRRDDSSHRISLCVRAAQPSPGSPPSQRLSHTISLKRYRDSPLCVSRTSSPASPYRDVTPGPSNEPLPGSPSLALRVSARRHSNTPVRPEVETEAEAEPPPPPEEEGATEGKGGGLLSPPRREAPALSLPESADTPKQPAAPRTSCNPSFDDAEETQVTIAA